MKIYPLFAIAALFFSLMACDSTLEEEETICLPVNMTVTLVQSSMTSKIIADFHYVPETDLIDHITWSNHQTHYFEYDASGSLTVVRAMKVDAKVQEEMWFVYDGSLVERVDLVLRNLDYVYLEPLDSIYAGYVEMEYNGNRVIRESEYEITSGGYKEEYVRNVSYEYDNQGNLISRTELNPATGETEHLTLAYDKSKHPFGGLQYYFTGESFVNNMVSKSVEETGFEYTYDLRLNEYEYPETVYEKLGSSNTRIFKYAYTIR
jgi:hypothetical protein